MINPINFIKEKIETKKENPPKIFETFTKLWVSILLIISLIDLQLSYVLAFMGMEQIAESLSIAVVTEIIGVIAVYMIRAYFDTKTEKNHELEVMKLQLEDESEAPEYEGDADEDTDETDEG